MKAASTFHIDTRRLAPDARARRSARVGTDWSRSLSSHSFEALVEQSLIGVVVIQDGRFVYVNERMAEMVGYDREEVTTDHTVLDFIHPDDHEMVMERIQERISGELLEVRYRFRLIHRSGRTVHVEAHGSRSTYQGRPAVVSSVFDVSEHVAMLAELQESERRFRRMTEHARDFIFRYRLRPDREFEYVSPSATRTTGYTPEDFYRSPNLILKIVHARDRQLFRQLYEGSSVPSEPVVLRIRHKSGRKIWAEIQFTPVENEQGTIVAVEGIGRDITQRIEAEDNGRLLNTAVAAAANAVIITDADGVIQWANPAFARLTGWSRDEVVGQSADLVSSGLHDDQFYNELWATISYGNVWSGQLVNRRRDGSEYTEHMTITPVTDRYGEISNFIAVKEDITDRVEYERGLVQSRNEAQEIARTKDTLLNNLSHELRTPLTAVLGFAQILVQEVPDDLLEFAEEVYSGGTRLRETFDSVLDLARLEANKITLRPEPVDLIEESRLILGENRLRLEEKGIRGAVRGDSSPILLDRVIVGRILTNLISNAVKFTDDGEINVDVTVQPQGAMIRVSDTGQGISDDFLPHLYEEFRQESDGLRRTHEGIGIGLTIVRRLVELHGGTINVTSRKGVGTTFTIWMPELKS